MSLDAYRKTISATEDPTSIELRVFGRVTGALKAASEGGQEAARIAALYENYALWSTLMRDLGSDGNQFPDPLKAQLISLGLWSCSYSTRAISEAVTLAPLIDVNNNIIAGLQGQLEHKAGSAAAPAVRAPA